MPGVGIHPCWSAGAASTRSLVTSSHPLPSIILLLHPLQNARYLNVSPLASTQIPSLSPVSSIDWCPRKTVVENVFHRMIRHRVLHIRGTPASGKTILRLLLTRHIRLSHPNWHITSLEAWPEGLQKDDLVGTEKFIEYRLSISRDEWPFAQDRVFLVDEAQTTYSNIYFWNCFLKLIDYTQGVYVVLFSSYGAARRPCQCDTPRPTPRPAHLTCVDREPGV